MAAWDLWFPDVMVHAPGAPDPLVRQALCRASREFFRRTRAWMEWMDVSTTTEGSGVEYVFDLPAQTELHRLERATVNGKDLPIQNYRQRASDWTQHPQGAQGLISRDLLSYSLVGAFPAGESIQVQASLIPTLTATGIPNHLANQYLEVIAEGAKALLLMTPGAAFSQPDLAALSRSMFERGTDSRAAAVYRGHTNQVPRARVKWC